LHLFFNPSVSCWPAPGGVAGRAGTPVFALTLRMGLFALLLGLTACDRQRIAELEEGVATEADVKARFGVPEKVWLDRDMASIPMPGPAAAPGARTLEYNRQPEGKVNYMITIGADGRMSALRQVLTLRNFSQVLPGMPMEQVRKMLGRPAKVTPYPLQRQTHYDWNYLNPPSTGMIFSVVFDQDLKVVGSSSVEEAVAAPKGN
jgi:hypothetical protein